jgi:small-conductance mechanosensitive channel
VPIAICQEEPVTDLFRDSSAEVLVRIQELLSTLIAFLPRLIAGLIILALALLVVARLRTWTEQATARRNMPLSVATLVVNTVYVVGLVLGIMVTMYTLGIPVFGLITGLGIGGLVIGFALKDIIENLLAGVLILIQRPFNLGDLIQATDFKGNVTSISLRHTTLQTPDNTQVLIPNALVYTQCVQNFTAYPVRRRTISLDIGYGGDLRGTVEALLETVRGVEGVLEEPASRIELSDLDEGSIRGCLHYYIDTRLHDLMKTHNAVLMALEEAIKGRDLDLQAYPTFIVVTEGEASGRSLAR